MTKKVVGKSTIELTDVNTGKKEVFHDTNLITSAIPKVLSPHYGGAEYDANLPNVYNTNLYPIVKKALGGILLYEEALSEDPNMLYAPVGNKLVGCASNNANSTASTIRGAMNLSESGPLEDGKGYRFVFDFATSQANGTISSIALTSALGGVAGWGESYDTNNALLCVGQSGTMSTALTAINYAPYATIVVAMQNFVEVRADKNDIVSIVGLVSGEFVIYSTPFYVDKVAITENNVLNSTPIELARFTPSSAFFNATNSSSTAQHTAMFFDGGDGYWWGISHSSYSSKATATVYWCKISKEDYTVTEGTWTLNDVTLAYSYATSYDPDNPGTGIYSGQGYCRSAFTGAIAEGNCYLLSYDRKSARRIRLDNPTDQCDVAFDEDVTHSASVYPIRYLVNIMGRVYCAKGFVEGDTYTPAPVYQFSTYGSNWPTSNRSIPFTIAYYRYNGTNKLHLRLIAPYLATINNLETPVTKTADKTMKITYILREE